MLFVGKIELQPLQHSLIWMPTVFSCKISMFSSTYKHTPIQRNRVYGYVLVEATIFRLKSPQCMYSFIEQTMNGTDIGIEWLRQFAIIDKMFSFIFHKISVNHQKIAIDQHIFCLVTAAIGICFECIFERIVHRLFKFYINHALNESNRRRWHEEQKIISLGLLIK